MLGFFFIYTPMRFAYFGLVICGSLESRTGTGQARVVQNSNSISVRGLDY